MRIIVLSLLMSSFIAGPAFANKMMRGGQMGGCLQETATLGVNFNLKAKSFTDAKEKFDSKIKQMEEFVKQQHVEKFTLQSMNYSVNTQGMNYSGDMGETTYQLNGNASYQLASADDAFRLGEFLTKQQFTVNVNVNRFGNGPCPDIGDKDTVVPFQQPAASAAKAPHLAPPVEPAATEEKP